MIAILLATALTNHTPNHWTITCTDYYDLRNEIMLDTKLDSQSKKHLIELFEQNTDRPCDDKSV
jgi:hypothetical protein